MSSFTELNLSKTLDTSTADIIEDFFVPVLSRAISYDRGVGFFSSSWIRLAAQGLLELVHNQGRARWITSPILSEEDWKALWNGNQARQDTILRAALFRNVDKLAQDLETDTLSALAWMVADGILDFYLALPRNKLHNEFHAKFGLFSDVNGNQIAFNGSYNDSITGTGNYEEIDIFCSWIEGQMDWVERRKKQFQRLWENQDPNVRVFELPEAVKEKILKLRTEDRPYKPPDWINETTIQEGRGRYLASRPVRPQPPPTVMLRDYQKEAIEAWFRNRCRGLFEMATGTGKTITALTAAVELFNREQRLVIIIACPFQHLVSQWAEEVTRFGFKSLTVFGFAGGRRNELANQLLNFSAGYIDNLVVLTTHDTFSNPKFWEVIERKSLPLLLIADEVHELGAPKRKSGLRDFYQYRLGLSATPKRWLDEEGTDFLFAYFDRTVFEFSLADAIPEYLTPYDYFPFFVELYEDELQEYQNLTRKIIRRAYITDSDDDEILENYLIQRQSIIVNARAKYECFESILSDLQNSSHTLVYCSPEQIDQVQDILNSYRIIQHRFTGRESLKEREILLDSFARGRHRMLVAMKCLDQGVDVPATRNAIILASSGNPKQFIQRRGRILRKYPGKEKAAIYDIVVVPTLNGRYLDEATFEMERKILKRELRRYNEFAGLALNSTHALNQIGPIQRRYLLAEDDE